MDTQKQFEILLKDYHQEISFTLKQQKNPLEGRPFPTLSETSHIQGYCDYFGLIQ